MLDKCIGSSSRSPGKRPTGYVAPWWEFSNVTNELLLERGIKYDHSLMHHDFLPYYVRVGDSWTKIDYSKRAEEWMVPLERGEETDLIEIPASWYLDDLPPMMFIKTAPNSHGFVNPRDIEQLWMDQFDWVYREHDYAVFTMTIHPDVSGRPAVLAMHERIIEHINGHDGVRWATFDEIADDFAREIPPPSPPPPRGGGPPSSRDFEREIGRSVRVKRERRCSGSLKCVLEYERYRGRRSVHGSGRPRGSGSRGCRLGRERRSPLRSRSAGSERSRTRRRAVGARSWRPRRSSGRS